MPKGGKPYPHGKKPKKCIEFAVIAALVVLVATPVSAGVLDQHIYGTFDHVSLGSQLGEGGSAAGYRAVVGPVATVGKMEVGLLSVGAGVFSPPSGATHDATSGGTVGFIPACTIKRVLCFELSGQRVDSETPQSEDTDVAYMGNFLLRPLKLAEEPEEAPPLAKARYLPTFAGLNRLTPEVRW